MTTLGVLRPATVPDLVRGWPDKSQERRQLNKKGSILWVRVSKFFEQGEGLPGFYPKSKLPSLTQTRVGDGI